MALKGSEVFESHFGFPAPDMLIYFLSDKSLRESLPLVFRFEQVKHILEIQSFLSLDDPENYDVRNKRFAFAVSSDGNKLLVDLKTEDLEILQDESGDIDSLDITIKDLLMVKRGR